MDSATGTIAPVSTAELLRWCARIPADGARALVHWRAELRYLRTLEQRPLTARAPADRRDVVAIWPDASGGAVGGSVTHVSGILGGLRSLGFRIGLVAAAAPPPQVMDVVDDLEVAVSPRRSHYIASDFEALAWNAPLRAAGARLAARMSPAFVYQRHAPLQFTGAALATALGVPLVLEWNNSEAWARRNWKTRLKIEAAFDRTVDAVERAVLRRAAVIAAVSEAAAEMALEASADPPRIALVPNAVDVAAIDDATGGARPERASEILVGWIGSFGPWHGAETLVHALSRSTAGARLRMIGDGPRRLPAQALAEELGVDDRIEWAGALDHDAALKALAACDVLASPHVPIPGRPFFGSPTKLFEYMALERPIVASALGQIGEVLEHGRTALLTTPGDPDELAAGIDEIATMPDRGRALGRRAREVVERQHSWRHRAGTIAERVGIDGLPAESATGEGA
jgi:glycosyltransferase involved in cell wall biosynthesis